MFNLCHFTMTEGNKQEVCHEWGLKGRSVGCTGSIMSIFFSQVGNEEYFTVFEIIYCNYSISIYNRSTQARMEAPEKNISYYLSLCIISFSTIYFTIFQFFHYLFHYFLTTLMHPKTQPVNCLLSAPARAAVTDEFDLLRSTLCQRRRVQSLRHLLYF